MRGWLLGLAFAGLLAIQVSPAAILAWRQTQRLNDGNLVRLAVETRDPRDLLRGEYSVLTYEIGRLQGIGAGTAPTGCDLEARDNCRLEVRRDVYVRLSADADGVHRADEVFFEAPTGDGLLIKGSLGSATLVRRGAPLRIRARTGGEPSEPATCQHPFCLTGIVNYGIERWYGAQGVPGKLDRTARKDILVEVRVASDGTAVIDGITVAGKAFAKTARLW
ncbi:GDYXXLXY domain-containing protein [Methylobacterium phyllosphaerae]